MRAMWDRIRVLSFGEEREVLLVWCPECRVADPPDITGRNNPRWKGGKTETDCEVCGKTVTRYPSGFAGGSMPLERGLSSTMALHAFSGESRPNWKGGGSQAYGPGWSEVRAEALDRDNYRCRVCGKSREEIGRNPDVHHIVPVRWFGESDDHERSDAHRFDNVVSLCVECHRRADFGHVPAEELRRLIGGVE